MFQMARQFGNRREVENLRQIDLVRVLTVNLFMDFDELEGACAKIKKIVVDADPLALERHIADLLQRRLDLRA